MNRYRYRLTGMVAGLVLMALAIGGGAHEEQAQTTYSGFAAAVNIDVMAPPAAEANVNLAKTQEYQDAESFSETQQHGSQTIGPFPEAMNNILSGQASELLAMTEGGTFTTNVATSMAVITKLKNLQFAPDPMALSPLLKVNADVILSNTEAECIPITPSVAVDGGSLIGALNIELNGTSVTGGPVTIAPAPNTIVAEIPGVLRVIANEQIVTDDSIEVIALHIIVQNPNPLATAPLFDGKFAWTKSDISSCPPQIVTQPGEKMEGKGAIRWSSGDEAYFCFWCRVNEDNSLSGVLYLFDNSGSDVTISNWWSVTKFSNPDGSTTFPLTRECTFADSLVERVDTSTEEDCKVTGTDGGGGEGNGDFVSFDCQSYDAEGPLEYGDIVVTPASLQ